jgi:hypothetical protein
MSGSEGITRDKSLKKRNDYKLVKRQKEERTGSGGCLVSFGGKKYMVHGVRNGTSKGKKESVIKTNITNIKKQGS